MFDFYHVKPDINPPSTEDNKFFWEYSVAVIRCPDSDVALISAASYT
jgi:hypothetical protein